MAVRISTPPRRRSGAASCTGVFTDRKLSAINSSADSAASRSVGGPPATIHPSFTCGRPTDFDKPARVNDSTSAFAARSVSGEEVSSG